MIQYRIAGGTVLTEDFRLIPGSIDIEGERIFRIFGENDFPETGEVQTIIDATNLYVLPGFIDMHIHGFMGADTCDAEEESIARMALCLADKGVTTFLPTTMTLPLPDLDKVLQAVDRYMSSGNRDGAFVAGVHLEGPYLSPRKCGAQRADWMRPPSTEEVNGMLDAYPRLIRVVDVAPEEDSTADFCRKLSERCVVSISHTAAGYDTIMSALCSGATHATHLFNAMSGLHHRDPGAVGAVLDSDSVTAELISDGCHVHPAVLRFAFHILGPDRPVIVSDAMRAAGMPDGEYSLGGTSVTVKDGQAIANGSRAGSTTDIAEEIRVLIRAGIPPEHILRAATVNPARVLGILSDTGTLCEGKYADIVLVDENFTIRYVFCRGRLHSASPRDFSQRNSDISFSQRFGLTKREDDFDDESM